MRVASPVTPSTAPVSSLTEVTLGAAGAEKSTINENAELDNDVLPLRSLATAVTAYEPPLREVPV